MKARHLLFLFATSMIIWAIGTVSERVLTTLNEISGSLKIVAAETYKLSRSDDEKMQVKGLRIIKYEENN